MEKMIDEEIKEDIIKDEDEDSGKEDAMNDQDMMMLESKGTLTRKWKYG